jgi:hypothetical protein
VLRSAVSAASNFARSDAGRAVGGILKTVARRALPQIGKAVGDYIVPGTGGALGQRGGRWLGSQFELGLQNEGLSAEDREYQTARTFVRFAADAARRAAQTPTSVPPGVAAQRAIVTAGQRYLPGLVRPSSGTGAPGRGQPPSGQGRARRSTGRWVRRGNNIVILGHETSELPAPDLGPRIIDQALLQPTELNRLSDQELKARRDRILAVLGQFTRPAGLSFVPKFLFDPGHPYWKLLSEATRAAAELASRAGRTFHNDEIQAARQAFEDNAKKPKGQGRKECIVILNDVLKKIWNDPRQKHTNETMEKAMALFQRGGYASAPQEIWFTSRSGRRTKGGARPEGLEASVWRTVVDMAGGDPGWSVFGMSVMDGFHVVTLTLDNRIPGKPKVFWSDQVPSWSGGWKEYGDAEMNAQLLRMVQAWWDAMAVGKKHDTVIRLWRLRRKPMRPAS